MDEINESKTTYSAIRIRTSGKVVHAAVRVTEPNGLKYIVVRCRPNRPFASRRMRVLSSDTAITCQHCQPTEETAK